MVQTHFKTKPNKHNGVLKEFMFKGLVKKKKSRMKDAFMLPRTFKKLDIISIK